MAHVSHGAHLAFDLASIDRLKQLLTGAAVYASGGHAALESYVVKQGGAARLLSSQLRKS